MYIEVLTLQTNNIKATKAFYSLQLGLTTIAETASAVSFKTGSSLLTFQQSGNPKPVYHFAFNIPQNKIAEAEQWCMQQGLAMLPYQNKTLVDFPNWNAKSLYFLDNNGSILELIARHDLNNATTTAFSSTQLLCISEIGIVADDVRAFCNTITHYYNIPFYEKQERADTFSVMGDANGLLIVVPEKRKWFPTEIISSKFPLKVVVKQNTNTVTLSF